MSTIRDPGVCVVVPLLNEARYLRQSLDSLLAQEYGNREIRVFDGGSTDGTLEILREYPVSVVVERGLGQMAAINRGWRETSAEFVTWWAGDDTYYPGAIRRLATELYAHPDVCLVHGDIDVIDEDGVVTRHVSPGSVQFPGLIDFTLKIAPQATLIRRSALEKSGMMDEGRRLAADWDLFLRLAQYYPTLHVPFTAATRRMHSGSEDALDLEGGLLACADVMDTFFRRPDLSREQRRLKRRSISTSRLNLACHYGDCGRWVDAVRALAEVALAQPWAPFSTKRGLKAISHLLRPAAFRKQEARGAEAKV